MNQKKSKAIRALCKAMGIPVTKELVRRLDTFSVEQIRRDLPIAEAWREAYNKQLEGANELLAE